MTPDEKQAQHVEALRSFKGTDGYSALEKICKDNYNQCVLALTAGDEDVQTRANLRAWVQVLDLIDYQIEEYDHYVAMKQAQAQQGGKYAR